MTWTLVIVLVWGWPEGPVSANTITIPGLASAAHCEAVRVEMLDTEKRLSQNGGINLSASSSCVPSGAVQ